LFPGPERVLDNTPLAGIFDSVPHLVAVLPNQVCGIVAGGPGRGRIGPENLQVGCQEGQPVRNPVEEGLEFQEKLPVAGFALPQGFLHRLALRDVVEVATSVFPAVMDQVAGGQLHRDKFSRGNPVHCLEACLLSCAHLFQQTVNACHVEGGVPVGNTHGLQLFEGDAIMLAGRPVGVNHPVAVGGIQYIERVAGEFNQGPEERCVSFRPDAFRDVPGYGTDVFLAMTIEVVGAYLDGNGPAVLGPVRPDQFDGAGPLQPLQVSRAVFVGIIGIEVRNGHGKELFAVVTEHGAGRLVAVRDPAIQGDPVDGVADVPDGEIRKLQFLVRGSEIFHACLELVVDIRDAANVAIDKEVEQQGGNQDKGEPLEERDPPQQVRVAGDEAHNRVREQNPQPPEQRIDSHDAYGRLSFFPCSQFSHKTAPVTFFVLSAPLPGRRSKKVS